MRFLRLSRVVMGVAAIIILGIAVGKGAFAPGSEEPLDIPAVGGGVTPDSVPGNVPDSGAEPPEFIQLVAVQMQWNAADYTTAERFAARVDGIMKEAASKLDPRYPALVVFPEDVGILTAFTGRGDLLEGITTLQEAVERMVRANLPAVLWNRTRFGVGWVRGAFLTRQETMGQTYLEVFSDAARRYGVYLVAGSAPLPEYRLPGDGSLPREYTAPDGNVYNVSYFFGPDGRIIGRQKKVNLIDIEGAAGLDIVPGSAEELHVFDTPLGRVGIAICLDAFEEEVLARLEARGADILVQPSANPLPWTPEQQEDWLRSAWKDVASDGRFAYAVNPMMTGQVFNLGFFGQSSIVARDGAATLAEPPVAGAAEAAPELGYAAAGPRPGFLAVAGSDDGEETLMVKVRRP